MKHPALHAAYPLNTSTLKGKQGRPLPYRTPVDMPTLVGKYTRNRDWEDQVVASCVHCHQIGDALRAAHRERDERLPPHLIYPFPGPEALGLELAPDRVDISRRVGTREMRAMVLGGLLLEDLPGEERQRRGLPADRLALWVKHVGEYGRHAAAKQAGFWKDDVLVEVAGSTARETESALIGRLLGQHRPGDTVRAVVLRGGDRLALVLPMQ
ncbi:MAG: hypothetical protein M5U12_36360 [Verrucomicrobia bacterium]|nr:hypothetical protein [Verrucomicrobiota bacterium]